MTKQEQKKETVDGNQEMVDQLKNQRDRTEEARDKVRAAFSDKRKKLGTPLAEYTEQTVLAILVNPLDKLQRDIDAEIQVNKGAQLPTKTLDKFEKKRKEAVDMATQYIEKMSGKSGLTAEVLERMVSDINKKASIFAGLLESVQNHDLVEALKAALGSQGESSDLPTAEKEAVKVVGEKLKTEFSKGDNGLMPVIWSILSFMKKENRMEIAKNYCNGKTQEEIKEFLKQGNIKGVFTGEEIQALNSGKKYSELETAEFAKNWRTQNDYKNQAMKLITPVYGNENAAGKMLTVENGILLFAKFAAGVTVVGNFVTGAWYGGEFKGLGPALKRLTNPQSLVAAAVYAGVKIYESTYRAKELLHGNDPKIAAREALKKERHGNPLWGKWDGFFKQENYTGAQVFNDYIQSMKTIYNKAELADLRDKLTPASFSDFLERMAKGKKEGNTGKNVDYAGLKKSFDGIKTEDIYTFAEIFELLNVGGASAKDTYEGALKDIELT